MAHTTVEEALGRVLAYLRGSGLQVTPAQTRQAISLVGATLDEAGEDALLEQVMERLPLAFDLPEAAMPEVAPPVNHGSIHYAEHL